MTTDRTAHLQRETSESSIDLSINLDGTGQSSIDTSVPFFDHMLTAFAKHSLVDLTVKASGDVEIDVHHTVEDIKSQRDRMIAALPELGFTPLPSAANVVLFGGVDDPHATFEALFEQGILIRDVGIPHHLRVTAGSDAETTVFLDALGWLGSVGKIDA